MGVASLISTAIMGDAFPKTLLFICLENLCVLSPKILLKLPHKLKTNTLQFGIL